MKTKNYFKKAALLFMVCSIQFIMAQVPSYVPTNGLVGYWPFSGNANDISGNNLNGTNSGAVLTTDRFGNTNSAYSFNGTNQKITVADNDLLSFTNATFTFSFWANVNPTNIGSILCKYGITSNFEYNIFTRSSDNLMSCQFFNLAGTCNPFTPSTTMTSSLYSSWHNFVFVGNGTSGGQLYIDGVLVDNKAYVSTCSVANGTGNLYFGMGGGWNQQYYFNGSIDDIGIWSRALTQTEISNMYNSSNVSSYSNTCNAVSGSLVNGLKAYYPFCGNSNDQSGNSYNGIVNGATLTTDRFGNANSAYYFNGTSNITCAYSVLNKLIDSNNSFTINLWFNRDASGNNSSQQSERLLFAFDGANTSPFKRVSARINQISSSSSTITVNRYNASTMGAIGDVGAIGLANNSDFLVPNTWYNFTYVYDGTQFYLYKNGQLMSITQTPAELPYYGASMGSGDNFVQSFVIGGNNQHNLSPFYGKLDDVGIWNRALTIAEVTQLYNQNQCFTNTTVTDTLVINVGQMGFNPATYANNITIYPNPASTQVNISFNTIADLNGGTIKIINALGQQVATTPITATGTNTTMTLSTWGGAGLYFVQIVNPQGQIVDIKKILLQ